MTQYRFLAHSVLDNRGITFVDNQCTLSVLSFFFFARPTVEIAQFFHCESPVASSLRPFSVLPDSSNISNLHFAALTRTQAEDLKPHKS